MGIVLGIIAMFVTILWCLVVMLAQGMSDAPTVKAPAVWPWFLGGCFIAGVLFASHYTGW